jgi:hypothetical protein
MVFSIRLFAIILAAVLSLHSLGSLRGQELVRLPLEEQEVDRGVRRASTFEESAMGSEPTFDELVARLRETEARLSAIEQQGAVPTRDESNDASEFVNTTENLDALGMSLAPAASSGSTSSSSKSKKWYEKYTIRGYAQFRFNEVLQEQPGSAAAMHNGDSSVGENQSFIIRRARLILSGDVNDHIGIYLQPDFASTPNGSVDAIQFAQIRDWYADIHLDKEKVYRFRVGQSKVPYGWENLQSSSNRLPLDRNDAFNSAVRNERDLGAFFYWTPEYAQETFKYIMDEGLKGSGNYGVFGVGVYNGQGGSFREVNDDLHIVSRLTLPIT